jgi:APA family basic amino acid/polyamine antiporter
MTKQAKIGWISAGAVVVANMIGTGVFTSLGFQLASTQNTWTILLLWSIGGVVALAGAFSYAELGAYFKRSGGEYHYLSELYHPVIGYLSGWVSLTVGFSAPVALAAMAMGAYLEQMTGIPPKATAMSMVLLATIAHSFSIRQSSLFQNVLTLLKLLLIIGFVIIGIAVSTEYQALDWSGEWRKEILMPAAAVSLVFVTYSYTGWNAAAYIVEEIKAPAINLPKGLINGTLVVTVLYLLLQFIFLKDAAYDQLSGKLEVGQIVARNLFGDYGGHIVSTAIALFLLSSISAMVWVGPRVSLVMAEDHALWRFLNYKNEREVPVRAVWFQSAISLLMIATGTFEQVLVYCGFILQLSSALSVGGSFILHRQKDPMPYQSPAHPWLPLIFLVVSAWILIFLLYEQPVESGAGLAILILGLITYWISSKMSES